MAELVPVLRDVCRPARQRSLPASPLLRLPPTPAAAFASAGLPSSRAELPERAMSLCPVPSGASQNDFGRSRTRLRALRVAFGEVPSEAKLLRCISAQPAFLSACRFLCRTDSFHSVSSAELCLAHHHHFPFFASFAFFAAKTHWNWSLALATLSHWQHFHAHALIARPGARGDGRNTSQSPNRSKAQSMASAAWASALKMNFTPHARSRSRKAADG